MMFGSSDIVTTSCNVQYINQLYVYFVYLFKASSKAQVFMKCSRFGTIPLSVLMLGYGYLSNIQLCLFCCRL